MEQTNNIQLLKNLLATNQQNADQVDKYFEFPNSKSEYFSHLKNIANADFEAANPFEIDNSIINKNNCEYAILANGLLIETSDNLANSDCGWFHSTQLNESELPGAHKNYFSAITDFAQDKGFFLFLKENQNIEKTIRIYNILNGTENKTAVSNVRNHIIVHENSSIKLEIYYLSQNGLVSLQNNYTTILCMANSKVEYQVFEKIGSSDTLIAQVSTFQMKDSKLKTNFTTTKGKVIQNILESTYMQKNTEHFAYGIAIPSKNETFANLTLVTHQDEYQTSKQKYRCIANNNGISDFYGVVTVEPKAQKTQAFQENNNILLSEDAKIASKPQLIINADDVKCSHGSTTGQLDKEALFYMQSRGISLKTAQSLLVQAFTNQIIQEACSEEYLEMITKEIAEKLEQ